MDYYAQQQKQSSTQQTPKEERRYQVRLLAAFSVTYIEQIFWCGMTLLVVFLIFGLPVMSNNIAFIWLGLGLSIVLGVPLYFTKNFAKKAIPAWLRIRQIDDLQTSSLKSETPLPYNNREVQPSEGTYQEPTNGYTTHIQ